MHIIRTIKCSARLLCYANTPTDPAGTIVVHELFDSAISLLEQPGQSCYLHRARKPLVTG
jgi:hypothetical protein